MDEITDLDFSILKLLERFGVGVAQLSFLRKIEKGTTGNPHQLQKVFILTKKSLSYSLLVVQRKVTDLVNGGQIAVSVGEGWVDLDGTCIALQCALDVLHLLQGVAHVAVSVRKRRLDADRFFVMHQSLIELACVGQQRNKFKNAEKLLFKTY